jgi:putative transposase
MIGPARRIVNWSMRHRIYLHLVWTTLDRVPLINLDGAKFLCRYLRSITEEERARVLAMGIVSTHVHLLVASHPGTNLPKLVQRLKGASSRVANKEGKTPIDHPLKWAEGYNIQSVSLSLLETTRQYVLNQNAHHPTEVIEGWQGDHGWKEWRTDRALVKEGQRP